MARTRLRTTTLTITIHHTTTMVRKRIFNHSRHHAMELCEHITIVHYFSISPNQSKGKIWSVWNFLLYLSFIHKNTNLCAF